MGFRIRKSFRSGPFRLNLSKSGVGWSVGAPGFRFTKKAGGGTRQTVSVPGTGISYVKDSSRGSSKKTVAGNSSTNVGCLKLFFIFLFLPFFLIYLFIKWCIKTMPHTTIVRCLNDLGFG